MSEQTKIDLSKLSEPFPADDIEWRVSRADIGTNGIYCTCVAYITARAIQERLDTVCGIINWRNEEPKIIELRPGTVAVVCGISIRDISVSPCEWITKWDVAEPTSDKGAISAPAKGGFSGAMKRAGSQWGIGRYLYYLPESFAEVSEKGGKEWEYGKLPKDKGGRPFYWKPPKLPAWALPKEPECEISEQELNLLKREWKDKFAPDCKNPKELQEGFARFVASVVGEFPVSDRSCWLRDAWEKCRKRIADTTDPEGVSPEIPFDN